MICCISLYFQKHYIQRYFLILDIVLSKVFALDFWAKDGEIFLDIHFFSVPLSTFNTKIGNTVRCLFLVIFNIETNTATGKN